MTTRSRAMLDRAGDFVAPVSAIIFAIVYVAVTHDLTRVSRIFPHMAAAIVVVFGLVIILNEYRQKQPPAEPADASRSKAPLVLLFSMALMAMISTIGFVAASFVFLFALQLALRQHWLVSLAVATGVTAAFYALFAVLLGVQL